MGPGSGSSFLGAHFVSEFLVRAPMNPFTQPAVFFNRVFPPSPGATGYVLAELVDEVARMGGRVGVIISQGKESPPAPESISGVQVGRIRSVGFSRNSFFKRALSYLALYPAFFVAGLRVPRGSVLVTMTDPPLLLLLAPVIKWMRQSKIIHWAQDLYPEVAEELGVIKRNGILARVLRFVSTWALKRHDRIVAIGACMKQRLLDRGIPEEKIVVIPNWNLSAALDPAEDGVGFRNEQGWDDRFVVMYSGNFGLAHPFEAIIKAVQILEKEAPRVLFAFVGSGPRLATLKKELEGCRNAVWLDSQPSAKLAASLRAGDVHLASMYESACGLVVPSKVYGIVAAERPCIFLGPGESEAAQLLVRAECGKVLHSQDGFGLVEELKRLAGAGGQEELMRMRQKAREIAPSLGVKAAARAFAEVLGMQDREQKQGSQGT